MVTFNRTFTKFSITVVSILLVWSCDSDNDNIPSLSPDDVTYQVSDSIGERGLNLLYDGWDDTLRLQSGLDHNSFSLKFKVLKSDKTTILNIKKISPNFEHLPLSFSLGGKIEARGLRYYEGEQNLQKDSIEFYSHGAVDYGFFISEKSLENDKKFDLLIELYTQGLENKMLLKKYTIIIE